MLNSFFFFRPITSPLCDLSSEYKILIYECIVEVRLIFSSLIKLTEMLSFSHLSHLTHVIRTTFSCMISPPLPFVSLLISLFSLVPLSRYVNMKLRNDMFKVQLTLVPYTLLLRLFPSPILEYILSTVNVSYKNIQFCVYCLLGFVNWACGKNYEPKPSMFSNFELLLCVNNV